MLIRSMAPKVICADEIGSNNDICAINNAICSGVKGVFTAHGNSIKNLRTNPAMKKILELFILERIVFLSNRNVLKVYYLDTKNLEYKVME